MQQSLMIPPGQHQLPPLPYAHNALEPVISPKTLQIYRFDKKFQINYRCFSG
ncbi:hypothetical protein [Geosporobacter ferrireducens]|uniref:hypothetical protein n=1 Tax=Geosporobacter ferrireducens TaxID=1424294 RepID=UPI0009F31FC7|nr:hypothetical protein [Geosporobacter ferrireducens]MTI54949.1 hypothetical protein [Geosporobacter ferrireducens]